MVADSKILEVRDLTVRLDRREEQKTILDGVSFDLHPGEILGIIGEAGSGKTLLCRMLLNTLESEGEVVTAYIPNPQLSPLALHLALAEELGVEVHEEISLHHVGKVISRRLIEINGEGRGVVVLIDEAQAMPDETLEAVRLITNLETEKHKLLQIVLFGQNELDQRLAQEGLRQLRQRITFSHELQPLRRNDVSSYINHRLNAAGYNGPPLFDGRACAQLHRASHGLPRLINVYAHKAMLAAFGRGEQAIEPRHVNAAVSDGQQPQPADEKPAIAIPVWLGGALLVAAMAALVTLPTVREGLGLIFGGLVQ